ncbi:MAG: BamA/TamA family outer membrane protein [Prolixibacteraceae bacterium]|nr:BamA/TamA family outer membrane protein [Prolixibacteraceae bacterium]
MLLKKFLILFFCIVTLSVYSQKVVYSPDVKGWENEVPENDSGLLYSVFLIGDLKYPSSENVVLKLLQKKLGQQTKQSALVVLGDIVYPYGLPDKDDDDYQPNADTLVNILKTVKDFKGEIVFIPGNHDWENGKSEGWDRVKNEEKFIEKYLDRGNTFLPDKGRPGPVEVNLTEDITLVVFDSQWWFHQFEKPTGGSDEEEINAAGLLVEIQDILRRNKNKKVIFATHHPLHSVGVHGGNFPAYSLLFPFMMKNKNAVIPAPGFIYTSYRKYFGTIQDMANPEYKIYTENLEDQFKEFPNLIFAAGHEHNLQYVEKDSLHQIISGGGGEATYIAKKENKTDFAAQSTGFSVLKFYNNGDVWVEFLSPDETGEGKLLFRKKLFNKPVYNEEQEKQELSLINFNDSVVNTKLSDKYKAGKLHRFLMGDNYRDVWDTEIDFPVFDIGTEKGGLKILSRGGGQQTKSFRLRNKETKKQYVLRSVNKDVFKILPDFLRNTVAYDLIQDGISASHPFAAITVPKMADAIGVLHTNPKYVWMPDDPRFGIYQEDLANGIFLFEERATGYWEGLNSFGNSKEIISTDDALENIWTKQDHKIDQDQVLKSRIFDLFINDWDRHDDQWRWATYKEDDKIFYRPIPRDRDQPYFVNQGIIPWIASRKWINPQVQGFDYDSKNISGLIDNARYFDRTFLNEPDLDKWMETAEFIKTHITDSVIHSAISEFPPEIYKLTGAKIEDILKARREKLSDFAREHYMYISRTVDVVGTNDREFFEADRKENGDVEVTVTELSDKKAKLKDEMYHRIFRYGETKEIRLYGLSEEDQFEITGNSNKGIKIRVIAGKGKDEISDKSRVKGLSKKTLIYDRNNKKNSIKKGPETRLKLADKKWVNRYERMQFRPNKTMPLASAGFNIDDGFYLGAGFFNQRYNFRDSTYHKVHFNYAFETGAFAAFYNGLYSSVSQHFDLLLDVEASFPRNVENFFGFGNESERLVASKEYYRMRYEFIGINPKLQFYIGRNVSYSMGAFYQYYNVTDTTGRFVSTLYPEAFKSHHYAGLNADLMVDTRDNPILPKRGIYWANQVADFYKLGENNNNFFKAQSDISFYLSFRKDPRVVLALRAGGAVNFGDYEFYNANYLGGKTNIRGLYSNRYAGDKSFYQNTELRIKLTNLRSYIFNGQLGLLVFNDVGRVWYKNEKSKEWHRGTGVGLWLTPFDFTAISATYNFASEENSFGFTFSFMY